MDENTAFEESFRALTGNRPLNWQRRLFLEHFVRSDIPPALDIPTGLGKTSVIAIWLIARAAMGMHSALPRRLIYVVDRRAVVDQATSEAQKLRAALEGEAGHFDRLDENAREQAKRIAAQVKKQLGFDGKRTLPISTLRGAHADNREWLDDPAVPAIVVGTVDMIGSRLLFSGYGVGRKMRPFHAGLLGADALVVLDEAHLVPPFQSLVEEIEQQSTADRERTTSLFQIPVFRAMALSATGRDTGRAIFTLEDRDVEHDETARKRINAPKSILLADVSGNLAQALAERAWQLGDEQNRVIVFCNSRKVAGDVYEELEGRLEKLRGKEAAPGAHLELIVGARRVRERELLADMPVFRRFARLPSKDDQPQSRAPDFLVATSAGEVGVDIDADHMVCDLVAWERMVQRLGRVNRRGEFVAGSLVDVLVAPADKEAEDPTGSPGPKDCRAPFEAADWPQTGDGRLDASLRILRRLRRNPEFRRLTERATTVAPLYPILTPQLLDAWSMTSLWEHPGRPEKVEPWIRGWIDEERDLPQSELLWRRHLPIRAGEDNQETERELAAFFDAAPPHISEILETETYRVVDMLRARARTLLRQGGAASNEGEGPPDAMRRLTGRTIVAVVLNRDGSIETLLTLAEINSRDSNGLRRLLAERRIVLDARFGGLAESGLLDSKEDETPSTLDGGTEDRGGAGLWNDARLRERGLGFRVRVARRSGNAENWKVAYRRFIDAESEEADDAAEREEWRVEEWVGEGAAENQPALAKVAQKLDFHRDRVIHHAERIARNLNLPDDLRTMLVAAARFHDSGKARPIWQRFAGNYGFARDRTSALAKFAVWANPRLLKVGDDIYRHEFGSLHDAMDDKAFDGLPPPLQRLGLRLIAGHHGNARPNIFAFDEYHSADCSLEMAQRVARDFRILHAQWGPWGVAWWEALLRAADVSASRETIDEEIR